MSFIRAVAVNTIIQLIGRVVTTLLSLVLIAALTRYLGVTVFGEYTTVFAYVAFFGVLADFGFFWIMVREIAKIDEKREFDRIVSNVLTLRTFLGVGVFGISALAAWLIPQYTSDVRIGIAVISGAWLATALNSTFVGVFQNKLRMDLAVLTDVIGRAVILVFTLWLITRQADLTTILLAYVVGTWLNFIVSYLLGRKFVSVKPSFEFKLWKRIFWEAFPMGVVLILHVIYFRIDSVMLSLIKGPTDVGIYGAPYKVLEVLLTLPVMFLGNVFPALTRLLTDRSSKATLMIQRSFDALLAIALPLTIGGIVLAEPIIRVVAGEEFVRASTINSFFGQSATGVLTLKLLMVAVGIAFISNLFNYILIALGRQKELIKPYLIFGLANVAINLLIIPKLSYIGAAISTLITELIVVTYLGNLALKAIEMKLAYKLTTRIALSTAVMLIYLIYAPVDLWGKLIGGVLVYSLTAYLTGVINKELIKEIVSPK